MRAAAIIALMLLIPGLSQAYDVEFGISQNGLSVAAQCEIDGDRGYLTHDANGKPCLILSGSAYSMGYQAGFLMPEQARSMVQDYPYKIGESMLGISREEAPILYDFIEAEGRKLVRMAQSSIPDYLLEEMQGLADGITQRLSEDESSSGLTITLEDVLVLNMGFDAFYSILMTGQLPSLQNPGDILNIPGIESEHFELNKGRLIFPNADPWAVGCNEFVVSGEATVTGRDVFHGRDFMFPTGNIIEHTTCMTVYLPDEGQPFIAVSAPGFVGQPTAINREGLSMGVDVVSASCTRSNPGLGCLLVIRDIIQNCTDIDEAVQRMREQERGVSWLYAMADNERSAEFSNGLMVEAGMNEPFFSGPDLLPRLQQWLMWPMIRRLDPTLPDNGLMFRDQEWIFPDIFRNPPFNIFDVQFPDQVEEDPNLVLATNHFIIPRMVFTTLTPWASTYNSINKTTTLWRYEHLLGLIEESDKIDYERARWLIDFLNPNHEQAVTFSNYAPGGPVKGHHAIIDNNNATIEALFGFYGPDQENRTPWIRLNLRDFL